MPFIQMEGARFFIKLLPIVIESPRADPLNEEGGFLILPFLPRLVNSNYILHLSKQICSQI